MPNIFGPGQDAGPVTQTRPQDFLGVGTPGDEWFVEGVDCAQSTVLKAKWLNFVMANLRQTVRSSGATENVNDPRMLAEAMARYGGTVALQAGYSGDQYDLNPVGDFHAVQSYYTGMRLMFIPQTDNLGTGSTFVRVNLIGAIVLPYKKVLDWQGGDLQPGDFATNYPAEMIYDAALDGGNGAFIQKPWSRPPQNQSLGLSVGSIAWHTTVTPPNGYLECNGAAISRTLYADLYAVIGTQFGPGDGSTTFDLPDLRAEFIRGWDNGRGEDLGRVLGSAQTGQSNHVSNFDESNQSPGDQLQTANDIPSDGNWSVWTSNGQQGVGSAVRFRTFGRETRPRNVALLPIIKY